MGPIEVPDGFLRLERDGRFDAWGAPYASLTSEQRAALLPTRMRVALWWNGVEWDRSSTEIAAFAGDGLLRPGLVPFAGDGMGNHYCWYPRWQTGPEPPVVLFEHDELRSALFARDFSECLTRLMLQSFAADDADLDPELWGVQAALVEPVLDARERAVLASVGAQLSATACAAADAEIAAQVGKRTLVGALQPVTFNDEAILRYSDRAGLLRSYDRSVAFYRELVEEGYTQFAAELAEVTAARDARASSP